MHYKALSGSTSLDEPRGKQKIHSRLREQDTRIEREKERERGHREREREKKERNEVNKTDIEDTTRPK